MGGKISVSPCIQRIKKYVAYNVFEGKEECLHCALPPDAIILEENGMEAPSPGTPALTLS